MANRRGYSLSRLEGLERLSKLGAVRQGELGIELEQRRQHEPARGHLRMGKREPIGDEFDVAEQEQVHIDRARPVARAAKVTAGPRLDLLADVEQLLGLQAGPDPDRRVEEVRLVEDLADRLRLVGR